MFKDAVPVQPFVEAYERSGMTPTELARKMGYMRSKHGAKREQPDSSRVMRILGLTPYTPAFKKGKRYPSKLKVGGTVQYDVAVRLADALEMDYHDAGV